MPTLDSPIPNLFIIGAAKSGTTSLYGLLNSHPEVCMSSIKEPHFFLSRERINRQTAYQATSLQNYLALFSNSKNHSIIGEASPSYAWDTDSIDRILAFNPQAKFIFIMRDPFARAYSHYQMDVHAEREQSISFQKAILNDLNSNNNIWGKTRLYVKLSQYASTLAHLKRKCKNDHFMVLYYETFFSNEEPHKKLLSDFLGISDFIMENKATPAQNTGSYASQSMKWLKKVPGRRLVPTKIKEPLKRVINKNARNINQKEVHFLLPYLLEDLKLQQELGYEFYPSYLRQKYLLDIPAY